MPDAAPVYSLPDITHEQLLFYTLLEGTVTYPVVVRGRKRYASELGRKFLSAHVSTGYAMASDHDLVQRALDQAMRALFVSEKPGMAISIMKAGLQNAITNLELLQELLDDEIAEFQANCITTTLDDVVTISSI